MRGDDDTLAARVELGPARAAKNLLHVEHPQLAECALLGIIHLGRVWMTVDVCGDRDYTYHQVSYYRLLVLARSVSAYTSGASLLHHIPECP